jgi:hypothetical protein
MPSLRNAAAASTSTLSGRSGAAQLGFGMLYSIFGLLLIANTINLASGIAAMSQAMRMLVGGPAQIFAAGFGLMAVLLQITQPYRRQAAPARTPVRARAHHQQRRALNLDGRSDPGAILERRYGDGELMQIFQTERRRCLRSGLGGLLAGLLSLAGMTAAPAMADERPGRAFPAGVKRGKMTPGYFPDINIDGQLRRLAPGARIFNRDNLIEMAGALRSNEMVINYTVDEQGQIDRIWILTQEEAAQKPA